MAAAVEEMRRVFGVGPEELGTVERQTGDLGWAMAQWAVAHAAAYGLTSVTYLDQQWTAQSGLDGWQSLPTPPSSLSWSSPRRRRVPGCCLQFRGAV